MDRRMAHKKMARSSYRIQSKVRSQQSKFLEYPKQLPPRYQGNCAQSQYGSNQVLPWWLIRSEECEYECVERLGTRRFCCRLLEISALFNKLTNIVPSCFSQSSTLFLHRFPIQQCSQHGWRAYAIYYYLLRYRPCNPRAVQHWHRRQQVLARRVQYVYCCEWVESNQMRLWQQNKNTCLLTSGENLCLDFMWFVKRKHWIASILCNSCIWKCIDLHTFTTHSSYTYRYTLNIEHWPTMQYNTWNEVNKEKMDNWVSEWVSELVLYIYKYMYIKHML